MQKELCKNMKYLALSRFWSRTDKMAKNILKLNSQNTNGQTFVGMLMLSLSLCNRQLIEKKGTHQK